MEETCSATTIHTNFPLLTKLLTEDTGSMKGKYCCYMLLRSLSQEPELPDAKYLFLHNS